MTRLLVLALLLSAGLAQAAELAPFVRGSQQAIVAQHAGRPFVQALWSLDCVHCPDDLALLGKLAAKYPGLALVIVATDPPARREELAAALARHHLAAAPAWVFADSFVERLHYEIDPDWFGELPRTYFYEADGRRTAISGRLDAAEVEAWVREVLGAR